MADFDWVSARAACSLSVIFEDLKAQLQADVEKRNSQTDNRYHFKLTPQEKRVVVTKEVEPFTADAIAFVLNGPQIEVTDKNYKVMFTATATLNDKGECRLKIGGQERELWYLRKAALEGLFFS